MIYSFYHLTDLHYYSKKNFACDPWSLPQPFGQISFRESEEINKAAFKTILNDPDTKTAIITGDLTDNGDEASHSEMVELLSDFTKRGGNPFVFTDSHDYPWFGISKYDENGNKIPNAHLLEEDVKKLYYPFGRDKGVKAFEGDSTTFCAELFSGLYYIALGYEYSSEDGVHDPQFTDELIKWVLDTVREITEKGGTVICGTHWPPVAPSPIYKTLAKGNTFVNGEEFLKQLADEGVRLFFSGHTHIQKIVELKSEKGNTIYSIGTSALVGFPPKMRKITINTDNKTAEIKTIDMEVPELHLPVSLTEYTKNGFLGSIETIPYNMEHDVEAFANTGGGITLPKELILKHPKAVMFLGKKLNSLTYGKVARFTKKYHGLKEAEYAHIKDKLVVPFVFEVVEALYKGNPHYSPETPEYKIAMGLANKLDKITSVLKINIKGILNGYTVSEVLKPLLYNDSVDDDNTALKL